MLLLAWPASWAAFLPIVLVEGAIARQLLHLSFGAGIRLALVANAWSTLVGIPLTWIALTMLEFLVSSFGYSLGSRRQPGDVPSRGYGPCNLGAVRSLCGHVSIRRSSGVTFDRKHPARRLRLAPGMTRDPRLQLDQTSDSDTLSVWTTC